MKDKYDYKEEQPIGYSTKKMHWIARQSEYWDDNPPKSFEEMKYYVDYKAECIIFNSRINGNG